MTDLIDRQAALEAVCMGCCEGRKGCKFYPYCDCLTPMRELPAIEPQLCGYSIEYLTFIAKLMAGANVTPEAMASIIKDVEKVAKMVIEVARKQVEEAVVKTIMDGYEENDNGRLN